MRQRYGEDEAPKLKTILMILAGLIVIAFLVIYFSYGSTKDAHRLTHRKNSRANNNNNEEKDQGDDDDLSIAIVSAYNGLNAQLLGQLSDMTKKKYAALHGYDYYLDNHLFKRGNTFDLRPTAVLLHLKEHDWVWWSEGETFIVNPAKKLTGIIDDRYDVVMSRDWGGRQSVTASMLFKNTESAIEILNLWSESLLSDQYHDDLHSWQLVMDARPDLAERVKFVDQHDMVAYPSVELKDKSYAMDEKSGHGYYKDGDFAVHVVNCIKNGNVDIYGCAGIGAHYLHKFETLYEPLIARRYN